MGTVLLTGATGYVGGRLAALLEGKGVRLRCMARRPEYLRRRVAAETEVVTGDVFDPDSLARALQGVESAYYLIHSMGDAEDFAEQERIAARNFGEAARAAGVKRIVYLGGLGRGEDLSEHLASRQEVGRILRESGVPTLELRAGIIIGSGSLSFAMVRALVEKLPVMITPRWVATRTQPISIENVLTYLEMALEIPCGQSEVYEIGGLDRVSYGDLMKEYARQRGLTRLMIPVPLLTPRLSSLWLGLVTPVYARVGRKLVDGLRNETVVADNRARTVFDLTPRSMSEAIRRALANEDRRFAQTHWSDALSSVGRPRAWGGVRFGSRIVDSHAVEVRCHAQAAFAPIRRIGGRNGWYFANWAWRIRGFFDLLVGGAGLRRGRRDPERLAPGDALDFWRVEDYEEERLLRLSAEMKVPGRAWLQFEVEPRVKTTLIRQTAIFDPVGLFGRAYWYLLYPIHKLIFRGMLRGIARRAEAEATL